MTSEYLEIPHNRMDEQLLTAVIEEFVSREGTDYGAVEYSMAEKVLQVRQQLERGEAVISFDPATESCSIVRRDHSQHASQEGA